MRPATRRWLSVPAGADALAQSLHEIHYVRRRSFLGRLDFLALLLFTQEIVQRILIMIFKFLGLKLSTFGFHDMGCELEHVLWDTFIWNVVEIRFLVAHFVGIAKRNAEKSIAARLKRHDMFARCEDDFSKRNHPFLADCL